MRIYPKLYLSAAVSVMALTWEGDATDVHVYTIGEMEVIVGGPHTRVTVHRDQTMVLAGEIGRTLPKNLPEVRNCSSSELCLDWGGWVRLEVTVEDSCYNISWSGQLLYFQDCFNLEGAYWYGGAELSRPQWPLRNMQLSESAYLPLTFLTSSQAGSIAEPYWLSSLGVAFNVPDTVPLFHSFNSSEDGLICFSAKHGDPYHDRDHQTFPSLVYQLCTASDIRTVHKKTFKKFYPYPQNIPDARMMIQPIWSTWQHLGEGVNQESVIKFAREINAHNFPNSQIEIDNNWETCYGSSLFVPEKFPDPEAMVTKLKFMGFRTTLWVHPFVNLDCTVFPAYAAMGHYVKDRRGNPTFTRWWMGLAGAIDFTNTYAIDLWFAQHDRLRKAYGIDSFKFDAGESTWVPQCAHFPDGGLLSYTLGYVETAARFGDQAQVRTGRRTQNLGLFVSILDRASDWTDTLGIRSVIPTVLLFNLDAYFVVPDMIGGNGRPSKELLVRWLQVNALMPAFQMSQPPWDFDTKNDTTVTDVAREVIAIREKYQSTLLQLARQMTVDGSPINRPLWWVDPLDETSLTIDNEYLLGDDVLVAPVLVKGARTRDIYLPRGVWRDENDPGRKSYVGRTWLRNYSAPLHVLPYFTRDHNHLSFF